MKDVHGVTEPIKNPVMLRINAQPGPLSPLLKAGIILTLPGRIADNGSSGQNILGDNRSSPYNRLTADFYRKQGRIITYPGPLRIRGPL